MSETLNPTVVIEGRPPLPDQLVTRQTYLPSELAKEGVQAFFMHPRHPDTFDASGHIHGLNLEPGQYAWRLRDPTWKNGDPAAFVDGHGYNSQAARIELATRTGFATVLRELGLEQYGIGIQPIDLPRDRSVFIKPNHVDDVSQDAGTRALLLPPFEGGAVVQRTEQLMYAYDLVDHLGLATDSLDPTIINYLHAIRVFTPLWLPTNQTPAVELRITDPQGDIGKQFATKLKLLEPELVFDRLPELARLHALVRNAFAKEYGDNNYLTFDYIVCSDGSIKVLNGLVRALTPNLENQAPEVQHLANATADVEVRRLAKLAIDLVAR